MRHLLAGLAVAVLLAACGAVPPPPVRADVRADALDRRESDLSRDLTYARLEAADLAAVAAVAKAAARAPGATVAALVGASDADLAAARAAAKAAALAEALGQTAAAAKAARSEAEAVATARAEAAAKAARAEADATAARRLRFLGGLAVLAGAIVAGFGWKAGASPLWGLSVAAGGLALSTYAAAPWWVLGLVVGGLVVAACLAHHRAATLDAAGVAAAREWKVYANHLPADVRDRLDATSQGMQADRLRGVVSRWLGLAA